MFEKEAAIVADIKFAHFPIGDGTGEIIIYEKKFYIDLGSNENTVYTIPFSQITSIEVSDEDGNRRFDCSFKFKGGIMRLTTTWDEKYDDDMEFAAKYITYHAPGSSLMFLNPDLPEFTPGARDCPNCGTQAVATAFCPTCGHQFATITQTEVGNTGGKDGKSLNNEGVSAKRKGDVAEAIRLYNQAAALGNATAQYNLAHLYKTGGGVEKSIEKYQHYITLSAAQGDVDAQFDLASSIVDGELDGGDEGFTWMMNALIQGSPEACSRMGTLFLLSGITGAINEEAFEQSLYCFEEGASRGDLDSNVLLGTMYIFGTPFTGPNIKMARKWLAAPANAGDEDALGLMDILDAHSTPESFASLRGKWEMYDERLSIEGFNFLSGGAGTESTMLDGESDEPTKAPMSPLDEAYAKLDNLIGLASVKERVHSNIALCQINKQRADMGLPVPELSYHLVFTGNPGTGKTTVARIMADIYRELGIISKGQLVETDRAGLVAEYVGQTAVKTKEKISEALGGILFIDEAYTLVSHSENDFGKEAIDTLLKEMEDHRDDLVVIAAGYKNEMEEFIGTNPGLESRFKNFIEFEDYTAPELVEIFKLRCEGDQYHLSDEAEEKLVSLMDSVVANKTERFANGREARNLYESALERQAMRLMTIPGGITGLTHEQMTELLPEDLPEIN